MSNFPIHYYFDEVEGTLKHESVLDSWLHEVVQGEDMSSVESLSYVFCSDSKLCEINLKYLKTNSLTDVIAFDLSNNGDIQGEIYISLERVAENAGAFGYTYQEELHRVMVHGLLHLLGYSDKDEEMKLQMTSKEDLYLSLLSEKF